MIIISNFFTFASLQYTTIDTFFVDGIMIMVMIQTFICNQTFSLGVLSLLLHDELVDELS